MINRKSYISFNFCGEIKRQSFMLLVLISPYFILLSSSGVQSFWHHWFKSSFPFLVTLASQLLVAVKEVMHVPLLLRCLAFSLANMVCQS